MISDVISESYLVPHKSNTWPMAVRASLILQLLHLGLYVAAICTKNDQCRLEGFQSSMLCFNIAGWCSDTLFLTQIVVAKQRAKPQWAIV
jgi:hypothetical protein